MNTIAASAGLPKANLHYYFTNKMGLYVAVLSNILELWDSTGIALADLKRTESAALSLDSLRFLWHSRSKGAHRSNSARDGLEHVPRNIEGVRVE